MDFGPETLGNCNNFKVNDLLWASEGRRVVHHPSLRFINPYQGLTKTNPPHPKTCILNTNTTKVAASNQQAIFQLVDATNSKQTTFGRIVQSCYRQLIKLYNCFRLSRQKLLLFWKMEEMMHFVWTKFYQESGATRGILVVTFQIKRAFGLTKILVYDSPVKVSDNKFMSP